MRLVHYQYLNAIPVFVMRRRITKNEPFSFFSSLGQESPIDLTLSQGKDKPILPYEPIDLTKENVPPIDLTFEKPDEEECDILIKIDTDEEEEIQEKEVVHEQSEEENDNKNGYSPIHQSSFSSPSSPSSWCTWTTVN